MSDPSKKAAPAKKPPQTINQPAATIPHQRFVSTAKWPKIVRAIANFLDDGASGDQARKAIRGLYLRKLERGEIEAILHAAKKRERATDEI
jgi:hypothetical protein